MELGDAKTPAAAAAAAAAQVTGNKREREEETQQHVTMNVEEDDDEEVVTLSDVLKHNEQMTETADAVLGDASDTHCSYPMGYLRQAVYACVTCTPEALDKPEARAGVCLACTYNCHQDHELVELYTKRAFRCDCGNEKFPKSNPCKLETDKAPMNPRNTYSQNYAGLYCNCHRPYPDPERTTTEVMVQCVICEDWLHEEHISKDVDEKAGTSDETVPDAEKETPASAETDKESPAGDDADDATDNVSTESFEELICLECMKNHPFLLAYTVDSSGTQGNEGEETPAETGEDSSKMKQADSKECRLKVRQKQLEAQGSTTLRPTFWSSDWRNDLCQCSSCVALFEKHGIAFLLDPEDSLHVYEASAREKKTASDEEIAQRAFTNKLTHEQQVEVAMGYSLMKNNLQQYLAGFAAAGKTVRKEDIQNFFEGLSQAKRQKTE
ncbi:putative E3 ubiquitin-protein ligase ubr7 [Phytophthora pseudosyringae]|uniref:Putative E3 ubiquitin-protein ligase ubr7 n=1 Tax=Phytophthora pseudosyringae TaxID=221518 RepID=A0A8T1VI17_9STRA|nr:putative E3 ubiquitin-protein ligase ubr7 [Phytophthora pseudosyringae]